MTTAAAPSHPAPQAETDLATAPIRLEPEETAKLAHLSYYPDSRKGCTRRQVGEKEWEFLDADGKKITDEKDIERIRKLAIPPAYTDVWICPSPRGHLQATGRDAKGRKQYRYHPRWREVADETKYSRVMTFALALPDIRKRVNADLALPGLSREKVLACVVKLLETTLIRVGNEEYAKENKHYGLTTLRNRHVKVEGSKIEFSFRGKSGVDHEVALNNPRLAKTIKRIRDLPGQELFQYLDEEGERRSIDSNDVNEYLQAISGQPFTAKDFRTWAGTVLAAMALREFEKFDSEAAAKKNIVAAIERVAERLGNTPTICRKCYVHPAVLEAYLDGGTVETVRREAEAELKDLAGLRPEEAAVIAFLRDRMAASEGGGKASGD